MHPVEPVAQPLRTEAPQFVALRWRQADRHDDHPESGRQRGPAGFAGCGGHGSGCNVLIVGRTNPRTKLHKSLHEPACSAAQIYSPPL